jgi:hypothetical protein
MSENALHLRFSFAAALALLLLAGAFSAANATMPSNYSIIFPANCSGENLSSAQSNFTLPCTAANLFADDGLNVSYNYVWNGTNRWAGVRTFNFNNSSSIYCGTVRSVMVCYKWWTNNTLFSNAQIGVDNGSGIWANVSISVPPQSEPAGITCVNVTTLKSWSCSNFFGKGLNRSSVKAELLGLSSLAMSVWDVLFFNVTYDSVAPANMPPVVYLQSPANNSLFNSSTQNFLFNYTDDRDAMLNCTIYLDAIARATNATVRNASPTFFSISGISEGAHSWRVACTDSSYMQGSSSTRYFTIDTIAPSISIQSPSNGTHNTGFLDLNYTASGAATCWYFINGAGPIPFVGCSNTTMSASDGTYNISIFANDTAGNQNSASVLFTVDTSPPSIIIESPSNLIYNRSTVDLNYSVSGGVSCWYYLNDAGGPRDLGNCSNSTITAPDGRNNVKVYSISPGGSVNYSVAYFTVDTSIPAVSISSPSNSTVYLTTFIDLNYSVSEPSTCSYVQNGDGPFDLPGCLNTSITASGGSNRIIIFLTDSAGNSNSSTVFFTVDTIIPSIIIDSPLNSTAYNRTSLSLNYRVSGGASCWYYLNDAGGPRDLGNCSNSSIIARDGLNNVKVYSISPLGGSVNYSVVYFTVDRFAPVVSISSPSVSLYGTKSMDLNYSVSEPSTCSYLLNGMSSSLPGCANARINASEGANIIAVFATDAAGNRGYSGRLFWVDTIAPSISIESPADNATYYSYGIGLYYTISEEHPDSCTYSLNGGFPAALPGCANLPMLFGTLPGANTLTVFANDTMGNSDSLTVDFFLDTVPPAVSIESPTDSIYKTGAIDLNFTVQDATSCWYFLDGSGPVVIPDCANTTINAADGANSLIVYANDSIGNTNSSAVDFIVDTDAPSISMQSPSNITYYSASIPLNYTVSGAQSCWFYLDGTGPANLPNCANTTLMASEGMNLLSVYSNDSAGNVNSTEVYFRVHTAAPNISILRPANKTYSSSHVPLRYAATGNLTDSCWYSLNLGSIVILPGCSNLSTIPNVVSGANTVTVFANDTFGGQDSASADFKVSSGSGGRGTASGSRLIASIAQDCPKITVTVTIAYSGEPAVGAEATLIKPFGKNEVKYTDGNGRAEFDSSSSGTYALYLSLPGFSFPGPLYASFQGCDVSPQCRLDADCPQGQACHFGRCWNISCACGSVQGHSCVEYECCNDSACASGLRCEANKCIECAADSECAAAEHCSNSKCVQVPKGDCGVLSNHSWLQYQCCFDSDCDAGESCLDNSCIVDNYSVIVQGDVIAVWKKIGLVMTNGGEPLLAGTVVKITTPSGHVFTAVTDSNGALSFVPDEGGTYVLESQGAKSRATFSVGYPVVVQSEGSGCCALGICGSILGMCWYSWLIPIPLVAYIAYLLLSGRTNYEKERDNGED